MPQEHTIRNEHQNLKTESAQCASLVKIYFIYTLISYN